MNPPDIDRLTGFYPQDPVAIFQVKINFRPGKDAFEIPHQHPCGSLIKNVGSKNFNPFHQLGLTGFS